MNKIPNREKHQFDIGNGKWQQLSKNVRKDMAVGNICLAVASERLETANMN